MKSKFLSVLIILAVLLDITPAFGTSTYIINEDFSSDVSLFTLSGAGAANTTVTRVTDGSNSYAKITANNANNTTYVDKSLESITPAINTTTGKITFETRIKFSMKTFAQFSIYGKVNSPVGYPPLVTVNSSSNISTFFNGATPQPSTTYTTDTNSDAPDFSTGWQTIWAEVDFDKKQTTVYWNDKAMSVVFPNATIDKLFVFRISPQTQTNTKGITYVDYVKMYQGPASVPEPPKTPVAKFFNGMDIGSVIGVGSNPISMDGVATADVINHPQYGRTLKIMRTNADGTSPQPSISIPSWFRLYGGTIEYKIMYDSGAASQMRILNSGGTTETFVVQVQPDDGTFNFISPSVYNYDGHKDKWITMKLVFRPNADTTKTDYDFYLNGVKQLENITLNKPLTEFGMYRYTLMATNPIYVQYISIVPNDYELIYQPTAIPALGKIEYGSAITLSAGVGETIYYTTNGTTPTTSSTIYSTPIEITTNNQIIKAISVKGENVSAPTVFGPYTFDNYDGLIFKSMSFKKLGVEVTNMSQITGGDIITAEFTYANVSGTTVNAEPIILLQNGNITKAIKSASVTFPVGISTQTVSLTLPQSISNCKILSYMWNGIDAGKPYSDIFTLEATTPIPSETSLTNVGIAINVKDSKITVGGKIVGGKYVSVRVKNTSTSPNTLITARQALVSDNGDYNIIVELDSSCVSGNYEVLVGGTNVSTPQIETVAYLDKAGQTALVGEINAATDTNVLEQIIENNKGALELITNDVYYTNNKYKVLNIFMDSTHQQAIASFDEVKAYFNRSILTSKINDATSGFGLIIANKDLLMAETKYEVDKITSTFLAEFNSLMEVKVTEVKPNTVKELMDLYYDTFVLSRLNTYAKTGQISNIVTLIGEYNDVLKFDVNGKYKGNETTVAKAFSFNTYRTIGDAAQSFTLGVNSIPTTPTNGGNTPKTSYPVSEVKIQGKTEEQPTYENIGSFDDLDNVMWAYEQIEHLSKKGIISGKGVRTFSPNDNITRAEFVKIIVGAFGITETNDSCSLTDVKSSEWYYKYVATAYKNGIVTGDGNVFGVDDYISRQDAAVIVARAIKNNGITPDKKRELITFTDLTAIAEYATSDISMLYSAEIINGIGNNKFEPQSNITRAEAAVMIFNATKGGEIK